MMSSLYGVDVRTINDHIQKIYDDGELTKEATIRNFRIVQTEGARQVQRNVMHYNLQLIINPAEEEIFMRGRGKVMMPKACSAKCNSNKEKHSFEREIVQMIGLGTIINTVAIIVGGIIGSFSGKLFKEQQQEALTKACGISVLFIAIAGAMQGMLNIDEGKLVSGKSMLVVLCLAIGTMVGEIIRIEKGFETFGEWLKNKTGNSKDAEFVNAFVTASLTVCIGAMAIVGAIQDGIAGDHSTLAVKSVLDFIIVAVMTSSLGKGAAFSAIPVLVFEGGITLLARLISPIMTDAAVAYLSLIGSVLIFCVGLNLVFGKKVRVANMLPAVVFAVIAAYIPWGF